MDIGVAIGGIGATLGGTKVHEVSTGLWKGDGSSTFAFDQRSPTMLSIFIRIVPYIPGLMLEIATILICYWLMIACMPLLAMCCTSSNASSMALSMRL
jgi:hypothetical protein